MNYQQQIITFVKSRGEVDWDELEKYCDSIDEVMGDELFNMWNDGWFNVKLSLRKT